MIGRAISIVSLALVGACGAPGERQQTESVEPGTVKSSGKVPMALPGVPREVIEAARAAQPDMRFTEAEAEVRDGRNYYDIAGTLPDGSEIELDMLQEPEGWTVVETQRDIAFAEAPEPVRAESVRADVTFAPSRVIESRQADGLIIYELFGPAGGDPQGRKVEIKWNGSNAELLAKEWAH